ncbi:MAG: hypothetical protein GIKADHBN_02540 [Phycisphaerales bacterium]|nr:hypothetical protein [Phycisphaerales bacterium]
MRAGEQRRIVRDARARAAGVLGLLLIGMGAAWSLTRGDPDTDTIQPLALFAASGSCALAALVASLGSRESHSRRGKALRVLHAALLGAAVVVFGAGWWLARTRIGEETLAGTLRREGPMLVRVRGVVIDRPDASSTRRGALAAYQRSTPASRFGVSVREIETAGGWVRATGTLRVRVAGVDGIDRGHLVTPGGTVHAGDMITLSGEARGVGVVGGDVLGNPGAADVAAWSAQEGIAGFLSVDSPALVLIDPDIDPGWTDRVIGRLLRARASLQHAAIRALAPRELPAVPAGWEEHAQVREEARALLLSLVLGVDEFRQDQVEQRFTRIGVVHVLAISGFHVALLAVMVATAVRLTGEHGRWESIIVAAAVVLYAAIVPASAPALRAAVCVIALMTSRAAGRRYDDACVLIWTAVILALWKPVEAFSLGYVLSFGLCGLLMIAGERAHHRMAGPRLRGLVPRRSGPWRYVLDRAGRAATATLLCWTVSAPIIAWWTGWFSPAAIVASIIIVPAVSLVLGAGLGVMVIGIAAGLVAPAWADDVCALLGHGVELAARGVVIAVRWVDELPLGSMRVPPISLAWSIGASAVALAWFIRGHVGHRGLWIATAGLAAWLGVEAWLRWPSLELHEKTLLRADVLAVGDGVCVSVRSRGERGVESMLIGAGSSRPSLGLRAVPAALRRMGSWRVDSALVLGDEPDHFIMLIDLARSCRLRRALVNSIVFEHAAADRRGIHAGLMRELEQLGIEVIPVSSGSRIAVAGIDIELVAGERSLRAVAADARGPLFLVTHDAPAAAMRVPAVVAASTAAGHIGVHQIFRELRFEELVLSTQDVPDELIDETGVTATATSGAVTLEWDEQRALKLRRP